MNVKLGIIGGGVMAEALLSRLIAQKIYQPAEVIVSEPQPSRRSFLEQEYGVQVTAENYVTLSAPVLLLAVKPEVFAAIATEFEKIIVAVDNQPLVVSILAGVTLRQLEAAFGKIPVIRAMPNTPATVGAGITAISLGSHTEESHQKTAQQLFAAVGEVVEVPEKLMDAVTGLSGSGPAYVAIMVEALADGGVAAGLPRVIAMQLALATVGGTVELLQTTKMHPAELKDRVSSPGGTTIAAIAELERSGFRASLMAAVQAAVRRSQELGRDVPRNV